MCVYAKIGLKSLQEYSADNIDKISDAGFLGILRVNSEKMKMIRNYILV